MPLSAVDRLIVEVDAGLRTLFAVPSATRQPSRASGPGTHIRELSSEEREESARLMRVNHCGEVCAQALYQGQAFVARDPETRRLLLDAAGEERDHLAWCANRLDELGGQTSLVSPFFYAGSFAIGAFSGLIGDKWSMGFLVETERQVEAHLEGHLAQVSPADERSRQIIEAMREDEKRHGDAAEKKGAKALPPPVRAAMRLFSRVMTRTTYRL